MYDRDASYVQTMHLSILDSDMLLGYRHAIPEPVTVSQQCTCPLEVHVCSASRPFSSRRVDEGDIANRYAGLCSISNKSKTPALLVRQPLGLFTPQSSSTPKKSVIPRSLYNACNCNCRDALEYVLSAQRKTN